ncbi:MAG: glycerol kinase, partial [Ilumatobacteraceae bacterium]|nr:glycerol kinase [Ilumatobacteraceae bacterium]
GASVMDLLCQFQADQLDVRVQRPKDRETTALGAAYLAGLAEGVWESTDAVADQWTLDCEFQPAGNRDAANLAHTQWLRAVERSRGWVQH